MSKKELIDAVAAKSGQSKAAAEAVVNATLAVITEELVAGNKVALAGFGNFEVVEKPAREGRNPRTGEKTTIAASRAAKFKALKGLKDALNA